MVPPGPAQARALPSGRIRTAADAFSQSLITIQPAAPKGLTRKQVRGGAAKWSLKHLPANTIDQFTNEVVPLARELLGALGDKPWGKLTVPQIQAIADRVYGKGCYSVTPDDWLSRNGLDAQPHKYMLDIIDSYESSDEEDAEEEASGDVMDTSDDAHLVAADAPTSSPKPPRFKLNTPEGRAAFVEWCLQTAVSGSFAFHWKGIFQGFLQSHIVLHTLPYHLACLEAIPGGYERLLAHPESAILLAEQAVHHELKFWRSGEYVNPNKPAHFFSADNYDDITEFVQALDGKKKQKRTRRATKFLSTVRAWDDDRWKETIDAARTYMELPGRKRAKTVSRSGSEVEDDPVLSDDDDVVVLSD
ncbi:hypothetical protein B0H14DRAFT_3480856 [Mycena olivaceomarginata]|nr:hypothetical protein B0H14DRAFT_3480856 [Mycena olivaceomarginata]